MNTTTTTADLGQRIQDVIKEALELADLGGARAPAVQIAQRIYASEPALMEEAGRIWILERLTWLILRRRSRQWTEPQDYVQLLLPEFPNEPKMIWLPGGERERFNSCSVKQVDAHIKMLKARYAQGARVRRMEKVSELMHRYSLESPGITWFEVKQRELARRDAE